MARKVKSSCLFCSKEFDAVASQLSIGKAKYCSKKCYWESEKGKKLSSDHKYKIRKYTKLAVPNGAKHWNWNGGREEDVKGYIKILSKNHPNCDIKGYVMEHRLVIEAHLGRILLPTEIVHHINGIKTDNRIENLMLFSSHKEHTNFHWVNRRRK